MRFAVVPEGSSGSTAKRASMVRSTVSVVCPECQAELDLRVDVRAAVAPPLRLHFQSPEELAHWLGASGFTLHEFERLPLYEWYRDEFEPLLEALRKRETTADPAAPER
jgi:hypothetical protein